MEQEDVAKKNVYLEQIQTENFTLRDFKESDLEQIPKICDNKKISDMLRDDFPSPYTLQDAKNWLIYLKNIEKTNSQRYFAIEIDGQFAGSISILQKKDLYIKNAEIGYYLAEKYWGKGVMTEAIKEVVKFGFQYIEPQIVRIYAEPYAHNKGSRRVLEKAGFECEVIMKDNVCKNNVFYDQCIYSLRKEQFLKKYQNNNNS